MFLCWQSRKSQNSVALLDSIWGPPCKLNVRESEMLHGVCFSAYAVSPKFL